MAFRYLFIHFRNRAIELFSFNIVYYYYYYYCYFLFLTLHVWHYLSGEYIYMQLYTVRLVVWNILQAGDDYSATETSLSPWNTISSKLACAIQTDNKILHIIMIASDFTMALLTTNY